MSWKRRSGFFSRQRLITSCISRGVSGATWLTGLGSSRRIAATVAAFVSPGNARRPVVISYSTEPNAKISERTSTSFPSACSGDMYPSVPRTIPASVLCPVAWVVSASVKSGTSLSLARPKSSTFTMPVSVTMMFVGLMSR